MATDPAPRTVAAIHHVQLAMPAGGEDRARTFYAGLLGVPEVAKPAQLAARGGCWFEDGVVRIHLGVEAGFVGARKAHPALLVVGLDDLVRRLRDAGHPVTAGDGIAGLRQVYVDDPFGNRIELLEAAEPSARLDR